VLAKYFPASSGAKMIEMVTGLWTDLFLILNLGDVFSTNLALNQGALEANLLYSFLSLKLGAALWAVKMVLALGLVMAVRQFRPQWLGIFRIFCVALSMVVLNNLVLAFVLRL
jgi:hypothetical protein